MRLRFTLFPNGLPKGTPEYHCDVELEEGNLSLSPQQFSDRFLKPVAACLLAAFEEPFPSDPEKVLEMLNRGGPERGMKFYIDNMRDRLGAGPQ